MSKLASISSNPTIREYAQGAAQDMTSAIADFLAPTVEVATSTGQYKSYDEKHRFSIPDTRRALGGEATKIGFNASDLTYNCAHHALDFPVDYLEEQESAELENVFTEAADMAAEVGALSHEKNVIDTALVALGAASSLSVGSTDDLIDQLDQNILTVIKTAGYGGLMGVGVLFGANAYRLFKNHASVKSRFVAGGKSKFAVPNLDDISEMLISKAQARVSLLAYDTEPEGKAADLDFLMGDDVIVFAKKESPTRRDPSFMKTFRLRGQWMKPGSYELPDGRGQAAKFDWSADVKVTNSAAGIRRSIS